jgi:autotransporter-associated beta strand protein
MRLLKRFDGCGRRVFRNFQAALICLSVGTALFAIHRPATAETWIGPTGNGSTGGEWTTNTNWSPATVPNGVTAAAIIDPSGVATAITRTFTMASPVTLGSITITENDTDATIAVRLNAINVDAGPTITFDNGASPATITLNGFTTTSSANPNTIRGPVVLNSNLVIQGNLTKANSAPGGVPAYDVGQGIINFLGPNSTMTGNFGVTVNTPNGAVFMADVPKAFTGPLVVQAGRIRFNAAALTPTNTSSVTVNPGGQLDPGAAGDITFGNALATPPTLTLNSHGIAPFPGAIRNDTAGSNQTFRNPIVLAGTSSIDVISGPNLSPLAQMHLDGPISGPGKLIVNEMPGDFTRGGELYLTAANNYSGGTEVQQGWFVLSGPNATAGTGNVYVDGVTVSGSGQAAGILRIQSDVNDGIYNAATLTLTGGGAADVADRGYVDLASGINETVGGLILGGVAQTSAGTYGAVGSGAMFENNEYFAGSGFITLAAPPGVQGDYNNNGVVDAADYVLWRKGGPLQNEVDTPGTVNAADYTAWRARFGNTSGSGSSLTSAAVPEPTTIALTGCLMSLLAVVRRKGVLISFRETKSPFTT